MKSLTKSQQDKLTAEIKKYRAIKKQHDVAELRFRKLEKQLAESTAKVRAIKGM